MKVLRFVSNNLAEAIWLGTAQVARSDYFIAVFWKIHSFDGILSKFTARRHFTFFQSKRFEKSVEIIKLFCHSPLRLVFS